MDRNFRPLSEADMMRRMTDRFAKLIQEANADRNEWRQAPEKTIAARAMMLGLYKVALDAVGQARRQGLPMKIEDQGPTVADRVEITFDGRRAGFERDRDQAIIIFQGAKRDRFDPASVASESLREWSEEMLSGIIVYLSKDP